VADGYFRPDPKDPAVSTDTQTPLNLDSRVGPITATDADLSGSIFDDINFDGLKITNARLTGGEFRDINLTGARFSDVMLTDVSITDAAIDGLTINGVEIATLQPAGDADARAAFTSVGTISGSGPASLPVKDIDSSVAYYATVLGFAPVTVEAKSATLRRDAVEIGLAVNGEDPDQASLYFEVSDVEALRAELAAKHVGPSELRIDSYGGSRYRVFFAREPFGVCFCFGRKLRPDEA
jgi:lactoylglutathione lyase